MEESYTGFNFHSNKGRKENKNLNYDQNRTFMSHMKTTMAALARGLGFGTTCLLKTPKKFF